MTLRARILRVLALALALLLVPCAVALADRAAFDRVSDAYANAAGQLDACSFSQAELESALEGIPAAFEDVVPELRRAIQDGIATHGAGDCRGIEPTGGATTPTTPAETPATPTTPAAPTTPTTPAADGTDTGAAVPPASTTPPADTSQQTVTTPGVQAPATKRDTRWLVLGTIALGALALLTLLAWGWSRLRGWDPTWAARARHAWGEAGHRVASTWSEFTDWLRLGR